MKTYKEIYEASRNFSPDVLYKLTSKVDIDGKPIDKMYKDEKKFILKYSHHGSSQDLIKHSAMFSILRWNDAGYYEHTGRVLSLDPDQVKDTKKSIVKIKGPYNRFVVV